MTVEDEIEQIQREKSKADRKQETINNTVYYVLGIIVFLLLLGWLTAGSINSDY